MTTQTGDHDLCTCLVSRSQNAFFFHIRSTGSAEEGYRNFSEAALHKHGNANLTLVVG